VNREHRPVVLVIAVLALLALLLAVRAHSSNRAVVLRVRAAPAPVAARVGAVPPVVRAICATFRGYCGQALRVAWCESRWKVWARNGQYLGLFQMGAWERAHYGHGWNAWAQSRAAFRYFAATGRSWRPWACRP
jgi:hypothetical protein